MTLRRLPLPRRGRLPRRGLPSGRPLRGDRLPGRSLPRHGAATPRGRPRLTRERFVSGRSSRLALQRAFGCRRAPARRLPSSPSGAEGRDGAPPRLRPYLPLARHTESYPRPSSLAEANRDRLLRRPRAVLAFADMVHLLPNELPGLGARAFPLALVPLRALDRPLLRHLTPSLTFASGERRSNPVRRASRMPSCTASEAIRSWHRLGRRLTPQRDGGPWCGPRVRPSSLGRTGAS
jgi:hypothetical protein